MAADGYLVEDSREEPSVRDNSPVSHRSMEANSQQTADHKLEIETSPAAGNANTTEQRAESIDKECTPTTPEPLAQSTDVSTTSDSVPPRPDETRSSGSGDEAVREAIVEERPPSRIAAISPGLSNIRLPLGKLPLKSESPTKAPQNSKSDAKTPPVEEKRQEPQVGDMVEMVFGRGQVKKIREDGMVEVTAIGWEMAGEQRPHFIMRKDRVKVVPTFYYKLPVLDRLQISAWLKEEGTKRFKASDLTEAVEKYMKAAAVLNTCSFDTKAHNARALEVMIPCYNNSATCYIKLKLYKDARAVADNVDSLCSTLDRNRSGAVMKALVARGVTESKVLGQWWAKSLYLGGRACLYMGDNEEAVTCLKKALRVAKPASLGKLREEISGQLDIASKRLSNQTRKAQKMWNKAFQKNSTEHATEVPQALEAPTATRAMPSSLGNSARLDLEQKLKEMAQKTNVTSTSSVTARMRKGGETTRGGDKAENENEDEDDEEEVMGHQGWLWGTIAFGLAAASIAAAVVLSRRR